MQKDFHGSKSSASIHCRLEDDVQCDIPILQKIHIAILFLAWFFRKIKNGSITQLPRAGVADSAKAKTDMAMQFLLPRNCTNKNKLTRFLKSNSVGIGQNLDLKILESNILANQNFCEFWQTRHEFFFFFFTFEDLGWKFLDRGHNPNSGEIWYGDHTRWNSNSERYEF